MAQENAWGRNILASFLVDVTYPCGASRTVEFQIESDIMTRGGDWLPGAVYRPEYYGASQFDGLEDIGESIAYLINEGQFLSDTLDSGIAWRVQDSSVPVLRRYDIAGRLQYMVEYINARGVTADCNADFHESYESAKAAAEKDMAALDWVKSYRVVVLERD